MGHFRLSKVISQTVNRIRIEKVSPTLTEDKLVGKNIKKKVYHFDFKKSQYINVRLIDNQFSFDS